MILDESTGGLNPVSEAQVLDKLLAHRADWIILIEHGKLKMQGCPKDLQLQNGEHLDLLNA